MSILIERIGSFIFIAIMTRAITPFSFGEFTAIRTITSIAQPLAGGGGQYALLHFGSKLKTLEEKELLTSNTLLFGALLSLIPIGGLLCWNFFSPIQLSKEGEFAYAIIVFSIISYNFYEIIKNHFRLIHNNRQYAIFGIFYSVLIVFFGWILSAKGIIAFVLILAFIPIFVISTTLYKMLGIWKKGNVPDISYWRYGLYVGAGSVINQLFVSMDVIVLVILKVDPALIAAYKIATIIPYSLFFLPGAFLTADFVYLTHHADNRMALIKYLRSYFVLFGLLTFLIVITLFAFSEPLIALCFGDNYPITPHLQDILLIGVAGTFLLRIPFGNILHAVGRADWNALHATFLTPVSAAVVYFMVEWKGVEGAAWATSLMLIVSGVICFGLFWIYLRKLPKDQLHQPLH
ncbi:MAG: hypothetical protein PHQ90_01005 [Sulfuricurvum sp.]|nr:hypothetical protein [Sulfuricurvum sp.]MDD2949212.1 hypothetical protein [Sulfuricurvum sp.]MDD5117215.1 hypothetical protein [Sulfuricurvum sp.]